MKQKSKIAILTVEDMVWEYQCWKHCLPQLQNHEAFEVSGLWVSQDCLSHYQGNEIAKYYRRIFGFWNCFKLGVFGVIQRLKQIFTGQWGGFYGLCRKNSVPFYRIDKPNDALLRKWLVENEIDFLVIMTPHILKEPILTSVNKAVLNIHASLLPHNRGLFPYIWAYLNQDAQGISLHKVEKGIDTGAVLCQQEITNPKALRSMTAFHHYVYKKLYTPMLIEGLKASREGVDDKAKNNIPEEGGYNGLLTEKNVIDFERSFGKVIDIKDFFV